MSQISIKKKKKNKPISSSPLILPELLLENSRNVFHNL